MLGCPMVQGYLFFPADGGGERHPIPPPGKFRLADRGVGGAECRLLFTQREGFETFRGSPSFMYRLFRDAR